MTNLPSYAPTLAALRSHPVPAWFEDAKLGIFIHWGLFSIPAFAARAGNSLDAVARSYDDAIVMTPYTEWYDNALRVPGSPSARFHSEHYGDRPYADFREPFRAGLERWNPATWARLFRRAGARYVVLVTKHHDGFCLWPSRVPNPRRPDWFTQRDVVGDLARAVRAEGLRFGVYYSGGIDWTFNTRPLRTFGEFVGSTPGGAYPAYAEAQVRELMDRYGPSVLWNDISWPSGLRPMLRLMADYYAAVPDGVLNDRWMHRNWTRRVLRLRLAQHLLDSRLERRIARAAARGQSTRGIVPPRPAHFDFRTAEYTTFDSITEEKWEATRGMSASFGYNRNDREEDYESATKLLQGFIDTVSKNGNLLLNVGPRGEDAAIPEPQVARLQALGEWLAANGQSIYGTRPWERAEGETAEGLPVRFTCKRDRLYVIVLGTPEGPELTIRDLRPPEGARIRNVANSARVEGRQQGGDLRLLFGDKLRQSPAHAFAIAPLVAARSPGAGPLL
ncbi:MAG: alpha-L-fucosidase [Myxococcota bacterium]